MKTRLSTLLEQRSEAMAEWEAAANEGAADKAAAAEKLVQELDAKIAEQRTLDERISEMRTKGEAVEAELRKPVAAPVPSPMISGGESRAKGMGLGDFAQAVYLSGLAQHSGHASVRALQERQREIRAISGMAVATPESAGFLVEPTVAKTVWSKVYEQDDLLSRCFALNLSPGSPGVDLPAIQESSRADGSRAGGVRAYWAGEGEQVTSGKPKVEKIKLRLNRLSALCYATEDLVEDASALGSLLDRVVPAELQFKLLDAIINGDGAGKPRGILASAALVSVAKEAAQAAGTLVAENIIKAWSRCYAPSRRNAVWLINQDIEPQLLTIGLAIGVGGAPAYLPPNGLSASPYGTLFGRPVIAIEQAATLGTVGDIVLADLSQYALARPTSGIQAAESMHLRFDYHEMAYRWSLRVDGQSMWTSTLTPFKGSNTQSPFVAVATRA